MMEGGEEKKGFTVRDRRGGAQTEETGKEEGKTEKAAAKEAGKPEGERRGKEEEPVLPEINFSSFLLSLSTSALMHLGEVPDPATDKVDKNLPLARQSIDLLGMLKEKTRGNLTPEEEKLLDYLLADLRWRYVTSARE